MGVLVERFLRHTLLVKRPLTSAEELYDKGRGILEGG
jgi:hypothetical protein